ncbi:MAG: efflux RND transporter periplasmic adaptor subunit [Planctomycetota bacterium]|jgi:HlyD family secretion protein
MKAGNTENQAEARTGKFALLKRLRWTLILVAVVAVVAAGGLALTRRASGRRGGSNPQTATFTVRRDNLPITVTENGDIKAINTKDIKSKVEGKTTIISIVDEGTIITPNDVNGGMVLVELDSSDLEQRLTQQEVQFLSSEASFTDANESLDIQKKQNESDIKKGLMEVKFKLMDLQKYLGAVVVAEKLVSGNTNPGYEPNEIPSLIKDTQLGGEALQKIRELEVDIDLKDKELKEADSKLTWTKKLYEKEYVSRTDLEADRLSQRRNEIALEKAKTAKDLFIEYEFPKEAEKRLSDYDEAKRELDRTQARARSKLAQAQARLKSTEATYLLHKRRLEKLKEQLEACTIKAPAPGQVVYGSSEEPFYRQDRAIEEGAEIWERQKIISIPDPSEMKVEIKVHETWIDKVKVDQKVNITVAAFPDKTFTGKVLKKAPLAAQQWFLSQDLKVYKTDVSIDGTYDFLKTGMSAKVTVLIDELHDVLIVPIQAVITVEGKKLCYCLTGRGPEKREVETGLFNDDFVEIKSGLTEGQKVMLNPPRPGQVEEIGKEA